MAIPLAGTISYVTYNQLVTVPQQRAQRKIQTALVTRGNLTIVVSANGTVQPESSVNVSPKTSGVLKRLLVKEGEFVQPGQIVAYMDNSSLQGQLLQAQGNLAAARANLSKVMTGSRSQDIAQAQAQVDEATAKGGDPVFTPIVVGTTVNDKTEVKSGLTGNERVLLSFPAGTRKVSSMSPNRAEAL